MTRIILGTSNKTILPTQYQCKYKFIPRMLQTSKAFPSVSVNYEGCPLREKRELFFGGGGHGDAVRVEK